MKRMFLVLMLLVFMISIVSSQSIQKENKEIRSEYGFNKPPEFVFKDIITTQKVGDRISTIAPDGDILNVEFKDSHLLQNFNIVTDEQNDKTKFAYQFKLPNINYNFDIIISGDYKGFESVPTFSKNSPVIKSGNLMVDFSDFYDMGLRGTFSMQGNNLIYSFSPDWVKMGYKVGDIVYLDPTFYYDFGGAGGVYAKECTGGSGIFTDVVCSAGDPLCNDCAAGAASDLTTDTDLDTSDDKQQNATLGVGDDHFHYFQFNITNLTASFTPTNITFLWEGREYTNTREIHLRIYNYDNASWETCNLFTPTANVENKKGCVRDSGAYSGAVGNYYNSSSRVAVAIGLFGVTDNPTIFSTDYVELIASSIRGNNSFYESTGTGATRYLNVTFRYENNNSIAEAKLDSTFITRPSPSSSSFPTNTTSIINTGEDTTHAFSYEPVHLNVSNTMTLIYENHGSQSRTFQDTRILSNSSFFNDSLSLYLLPTGDGIYVTFQVIDVSENPISGVSIIANRSISGVNTEVQRGVTGSSGTSSFFLDPDISHTFVFSKTGYNTLTSAFAPTQSLYTVTLGSSSSVLSNQTNNYQGISYNFYPDFYGVYNGTFYNFSFYVSSSFHALDRVGYRLYNGTGHFLYNNTCVGVVATGCNITTNTKVNTGLNTTIIMNAFWDINGNVTNVTRTWGVFTVDNSTGISSFTNLRKDIEHLKSAFGGGSNAEFTKGIISFIIILFGTAGICYRSGQFSPLAITIYMFGLTVFLDLIGMLPTLTGEWGGINGITILIGIIVLVVFVSDQKI